jgi:glycosyltransferase involved in cell wall biosynthesis
MKKSQRLLLISSNSSAKGGGERYLVYLTQALHLLNFEIHVLISTLDYMDGWVNELLAENAIVHRHHLLGLRQRPLRFIQSINDQKQQLRIASICREIAPDAILVNQQYDEDGLDYIAGALLANICPVGATLHMPMTATKNQRPFGKLRGKILQNWFNQHHYNLIFVSEGSQKEFKNYYRYLGNCQVVNCGCNFTKTNHNQTAKLPDSWQHDLPIIGFSGQFVFQKNLKLLIDAWLWTVQHGTPCRLLLIGDGEQRQELETYLKSAAPKNMWYVTGWQEYPETFLSILDIYAMTSHFEGLPLALIEAIGRGIPSVITNFNGATDVAKHASWVNIAAEANPEAMGAALTKSLNQLSDLKQQAEVGKKDFQQYFSLSRMGSETLAALGIDLCI